MASGVDDRFIKVVQASVTLAIRLLAVLMVGVIFMSVIDVGLVVWERIMKPPILILTMDDVIDTFSSFLVVLIAIEILTNIVLYLRTNVLHVRIVLATALVAVLRKVIVLNFEQVSVDKLIGLSGLIFVMAAGYFALSKISGNYQDHSL